LIDLENRVKLHMLLQKAILKFREGRIEEAISILSQARKDLINRISLTPMETDEYHLLSRVSALVYLAMLHYAALARSPRDDLDDIAKLTYLSQSLGISNILDGVLFPLLTTDNSAVKEEFFRLIGPGEIYREELCKDIGRLIDRIRTNKDKGEKELNKSIKTITKAVNPRSSEVRNLATRLARRFEAGDFKQARKIYEYVRDEIRYMRDPLLFEEIQPPEVTLKRFSGDCEDQAILLCSLLLAIGFETALIFADTDSDGLADHVYSAVYIANAPELYKPFLNKKIREKNLHNWIPLDPTSEDLDFGVIPFSNLEIKEVFFFSKEGKYSINGQKQ